MKMWKAASSVFQGGTHQINALKGKRVRAKSILSYAHVYDPVDNRHETTTIQSGVVGFVSNPLGMDLLIAYPKENHMSSESLVTLMRNCMFFVVVVNGVTFRAQFEVEL